MPFSTAMVGLGKDRVFTLAKLDAEDLATLYVVDTQLATQFPTLAPTRPGDIVQLTLGGFIFVAALADNYCIDAGGLDDQAKFELTLEAGCFVYGRGGTGGKGGDAVFGSIQDDGLPGFIGGTAIRLGCPTNISGIGTIERGYGGGGGGGGRLIQPSNITVGGIGGGGGAPLGGGGLGGIGIGGLAQVAGDPGFMATILLGGAAGDGPSISPDGGDGGSSGILAQDGVGGPNSSGGIGGTDGDSIDSQGFAPTLGSNIIIIGPII